MLKRILLFSLVFIALSCKRESSKNSFAVIKFEEDKYDFGQIVEGQIVEKKFYFTNTSNNDLQISNIQASCGCTVAEYPKKPLKSNSKSLIKVTFNSKGKQGKQEKKIKITVNTKKGNEVLTIIADVKPKLVI